jgi:hypothetical protein
VSGAWWPKTGSLATELPDLITVFGLWIGTVHRIVYDPSAWLDSPSRIIQRNSTVAVDSYRMTFGDTLYLMGTHSRDAVLFIIAPSCPTEVACRVLKLVHNSSSPIAAHELRRLLGQASTAASVDMSP